MLRQRLYTALLLVSGFLAALFMLPDFYWAALLLGIIAAGAWEWGGLCRFSPGGRQLFTALIALAGIGLLPGIWLSQWQVHILFWSVLMATVFWLLVAPVWLIRIHQETRKGVLAVTGLLVLLPAWLALVHLRKASPTLVLALMAVVWIADSAAYFAGKRFGRHKLAPGISPGKTWEGVVGALVAVSVYAVLLDYWVGTGVWMVVGLWVLVLMSVVGDLFESLLKRQAGLKDSGSLLPGHGGVLDRIDGLTSTLPLAAFYLHFPLYVMMWHE